MQDKCTTLDQNPQHMIAGIQKNDNSIEFFGIHNTMEVRFLQNGKTHYFKELKGKDAILIIKAYESDPEAQQQIKNLSPDKNLPFKRQIELYTYFCFGRLDGTPDIKDGELSYPENYRHRRDCISLGFKYKTFRINGNALKLREIIMIDGFAEDLKDDVVAQKLNITTTTLNQHKRGLFDKAGVMTKPALMIRASKDGLIDWLWNRGNN